MSEDLDQNSDPFPWAREMPTSFTNVPIQVTRDPKIYKNWLKAECLKRYKTKDKDGNIFLIPNAWALREYQTEFGPSDHLRGYIEHASGELTPIYHRPEPFSGPMGETSNKSSRVDRKY